MSMIMSGGFLVRGVGRVTKFTAVGFLSALGVRQFSRTVMVS